MIVSIPVLLYIGRPRLRCVALALLGWLVALLAMVFGAASGLVGRGRRGAVGVVCVRAVGVVFRVALVFIAIIIFVVTLLVVVTITRTVLIIILTICCRPELDSMHTLSIRLTRPSILAKLLTAPLECKLWPM